MLSCQSFRVFHKFRAFVVQDHTMIVTCENCQSRFHLDTGLIKEKGSKVRCSKCRHIFRIYPPAPAVGPPVPPKSRAVKPKRIKTAKGKYIPFKTKLVGFAAIIISFIGLIVIPVELVYRPIEKLYTLIGNTENLLGGVQAAFDPEELAEMNQFAMDTVKGAESIFIHEDKNKNYYFLSLNMLLIEGKILPPEELPKNEAGAFEIEGFEEDFDYEKLHETQFYWKLRFTSHPGSENIFRKYKKLLMKAQENAAEAGFDMFSAIYVMLDTGKEEGFFKDHIAFLLDGYHWSEAPCYAGEPYQMTSASRYWRRMSLNGMEGYDTSPVSDPDNFFLPRFTKDEWGTWFTVWLTKRDLSGLYNMFSIDFNADIVKDLLLKVFMLVGGIILVLSLMVMGITKVLSGLVTRPITELTKGAEEVAHGNYDYEVPLLKEDEFGELTKQFNLMTKGQKERLNLMETLEKFLSKELAEMAAKEGIVLGGQTADCTVMFTDFAGFSTITQKMTASEAVDALNTYFGTLIPIIKKYGGFPDKYIGDAIVALFGAPVKVENHAERAVMAAIEMQKKMREINAKRHQEGKLFFEMRIGLNSGEVIAGAIGCDAKLEYTSIGETTNLANRMEAACPIAHIKITEGTYIKVRRIFFRGVHIAATPDFVTVKGYTHPVATYSIYVDNLIIKKDMDTKDIKKFYVYETSDAISVKNRPEDVPEVKFDSVAKFIDD